MAETADAPATTTVAPYTARVLPPEEWSRLEGKAPYPLANLSPDGTILLVVEDATGAIVASWIALNVVHLEGLLVQPEARGHAAVAKTLVTGMIDTLQTAGIRSVVTIVQDQAVRVLADKLGFVPVEGSLHRLDL